MDGSVHSADHVHLLHSSVSAEDKWRELYAISGYQHLSLQKLRIPNGELISETPIGTRVTSDNSQEEWGVVGQLNDWALLSLWHKTDKTGNYFSLDLHTGDMAPLNAQDTRIRGKAFLRHGQSGNIILTAIDAPAGMLRQWEIRQKENEIVQLSEMKYSPTRELVLFDNAREPKVLPRVRFNVVTMTTDIAPNQDMHWRAGSFDERNIQIDAKQNELDANIGKTIELNEQSHVVTKLEIPIDTK